MTVIWCMVPEIWNEMQQTEFLVIWDHFLPFYPPNNLKNQNFEKLKKNAWIYYRPWHNVRAIAHAHSITWANIINLHKCTKNHDHMQHCSWDMARDRCNCYLSFWVIFCTFIPLQPKKWKFQKNENNPWKCHHFTQVYQKLWSYCILFLRYGAWQM